MRVEKREFAWKIYQLSCPVQTRPRVTWELKSESLHESFLNFRVPFKREQELHESWEARVCMGVFSTFVSRSSENKSYMRVEKREFAWEFSQLSCPVQTRTRVTWELKSESLHESFLNFRVPFKREQELHESNDASWEVRVCMRVFSTLMPRSNENKSYMRVDESWEARVCMRVFSTLVSRSNENKSYMRVEKREFAWEFSQLSCPVQTRTRVTWELRSGSLHESFLNFRVPFKREQELHESWKARVCMRVFSTFVSRSNENKSYMRVEKREFAWEFSQLSCPVQTRTRVTWELKSESLHESFLNFRVPFKREQELHESWEARVCMGVFSTFVSRSNENKSYMRVEKREFAWEFSQLSCPVQTRTRVTWE